MRFITRWFLAALICIAATLPSWGQDNPGSFDEMVARSAEEFDDAKLGLSCTEVNVSMLLGDEPQPELERLLLELAVEPGDQARHIRLGNYYAQRNLWDHAAAAFGCANGIDDSVPQVWNNLGIVYMGLGNPSGAATALRKAVKLDREYALAYYNLGMAYDGLRKLEPALKAYEKAITLDPKLATVAYNPAAASNPHQIQLFLRKLAQNPVILATSLDE